MYRERRIKENKDRGAKARKVSEYNRVEKQARRKYNRKLREELSDGSLTSNQWWNTVNTLSGNSARADIGPTCIINKFPVIFIVTLDKI